MSAPRGGGGRGSRGRARGRGRGAPRGGPKSSGTRSATASDDEKSFRGNANAPRGGGGGGGRGNPYLTNGTSRDNNSNIRGGSNARRPPRGPKVVNPISRSKSKEAGSSIGNGVARGKALSTGRAEAEERFNQLRKSREAERKQAMIDGYVVDPDHPRALADAVTPVGRCKDMCAEYERVQRIARNEVWEAEKVIVTHPNGSTTREPSEARMIKIFRRSAAGVDEQLPSDLRPPKVLLATVKYMFGEFLDENESTLDVVHPFLWDRTRAVRNDFSILQLSDLPSVRIQIECYEQIARFHILTLHQVGAPASVPERYNWQQDREQLDRTLLSIQNFYRNYQTQYRSPNEAEFRAYSIIFALDNKSSSLEDALQSWGKDIQNDKRVQTAVALYAAANEIVNPKGPLQPAARVATAQQNWDRFWKIMASDHVPYLMACVCEIQFNLIRRGILTSIWSAFRVSPTRGTEDWTLEVLGETLFLEDEEETQAFVENQGFSVAEKADGTPYLDLVSVQGQELPAPLPSSRKQIFSWDPVEKKRFNRSWSSLIGGMSVEEAENNGQIVESDATAHNASAEKEETLFVTGYSDDEEAPVTDDSTVPPPLEPVGIGTFGQPSFISTSKPSTPSAPPAGLGGFGQPSFPASAAPAPQEQIKPSLFASTTAPSMTTQSIFSNTPAKTVSFGFGTSSAEGNTKSAVSGFGLPSAGGATMPTISSLGTSSGFAATTLAFAGLGAPTTVPCSKPAFAGFGTPSSGFDPMSSLKASNGASSATVSAPTAQVASKPLAAPPFSTTSKNPSTNDTTTFPIFNFTTPASVNPTASTTLPTASIFASTQNSTSKPVPNFSFEAAKPPQGTDKLSPSSFGKVSGGFFNLGQLQPQPASPDPAPPLPQIQLTPAQGEKQPPSQFAASTSTPSTFQFPSSATPGGRSLTGIPRASSGASQAPQQAPQFAFPISTTTPQFGFSQPPTTPSQPASSTAVSSTPVANLSASIIPPAHILGTKPTSGISGSGRPPLFTKPAIPAAKPAASTVSTTSTPYRPPNEDARRAEALDYMAQQLVLDGRRGELVKLINKLARPLITEEILRKQAEEKQILADSFREMTLMRRYGAIWLYLARVKRLRRQGREKKARLRAEREAHFRRLKEKQAEAARAKDPKAVGTEFDAFRTNLDSQRKAKQTGLDFGYGVVGHHQPIQTTQQQHQQHVPAASVESQIGYEEMAAPQQLRKPRGSVRAHKRSKTQPSIPSVLNPQNSDFRVSKPGSRVSPSPSILSLSDRGSMVSTSTGASRGLKQSTMKNPYFALKALGITPPMNTEFLPNSTRKKRSHTEVDGLASSGGSPPVRRKHLPTAFSSPLQIDPSRHRVARLSPPQAQVNGTPPSVDRKSALRPEDVSILERARKAMSVMQEGEEFWRQKNEQEELRRSQTSASPPNDSFGQSLRSSTGALGMSTSSSNLPKFYFRESRFVARENYGKRPEQKKEVVQPPVDKGKESAPSNGIVNRNRQRAMPAPQQAPQAPRRWTQPPKPIPPEGTGSGTADEPIEL